MKSIPINIYDRLRTEKAAAQYLVALIGQTLRKSFFTVQDGA
jgi:hypothetical protein